MRGKMKIFLDDIRYPSVRTNDTNEGWTIVRNYIDFIYTWAVNKENITHISFDHDLGEDRTGYDALKAVEEDYFVEGFSKPIVMTVHSNNPVGVEKMTKLIKRIEQLMVRNHCK